MSEEILLHDSVTSSNMTPREKSRVISLLERALPRESAPTILSTLVETSLYGAVGASLGAAQAELKDGLDYNKKVPLDLVLAALAKVGDKIYTSPISRHVGNAAITVYSYRNVERLLSMLKKKPVETAEEPIAAE